MAVLIVDIETKAEKWGNLKGITRSALTHWIDKSNFTEVEKNLKLDEIRSRLALSPFTASIISLSVYDVERKQGAVYFVSDKPDDSFKLDDFTFKSRNETEILEDFWEEAVNYDVFVTFNGRAFVLPFIYHRSITNKIKPTIHISKQRYLTKQSYPYHVDLLDEFSFYGNMARRPSLQLLCGAYGIKNTSLLGGEEVAEAFFDGKFQFIAEKNMGDVKAIYELYEKWREFLADRSFVNTLES